MKEQFTLSWPHQVAMREEDYIITSSNEIAAHMVLRWPQWPASVMLITGENGSGKTHLTKLWASKSSAITFAAHELPSHLEQTLNNKINIIEDIQNIVTPEQEQALFHLCNHARQPEHFMLLTSTVPAAQLNVQLPDLHSRLRACPVAALEPPDDMLLGALIVKQFADRQIKISADVVDYLLPRINRSTAHISALIDKLDALALERKQAITVPLARQALEQNLLHDQPEA